MDKELLYKSCLDDVIVSLLFIVKCKGIYRRWLFAIINGDSNLPIHNLLTPVTIILLSVKLSKILNIKTEFGTFQTIGKEDSQRNRHAQLGKDVTMQKY